MKRLHILSAILIFALSAISLSISAQGNSWHSRKKKCNSNDYREHSNARHHKRVSHNDTHSYHHHNEHSHRYERNDCREDYGYSDRYARQHKHYHKPKHKRVESSYVRCLPNRYYTKVYVGGIAYYHCDGQLYTYHRGCGYQLVDIHCHTVRHLPQHCDTRMYDGRRYY